MKRLAVITTSLLLTLAAFGGTSAAFAEEAETNYPQEGDFIKTLTFTGLADYEIGDGGYYFLDGEKFITYADGERTEGSQPEDFTFTPSQPEISTDEFYFYFDKEGALTVYEKEAKDKPKTFEGNFTNLKQFGDRAYAVKDNVLYSFDGTKNPEAITLKYSDYTVANKIAVGQTASALIDYDGLTFVTVKAGAYMTEVDLTDLSGEYFVSGSTKTLTEDTVALLLCYTGNAAVIATNETEDGTCYVVLNSPSTLEETQIDCKKEAEFDHATISGNRIYSSPFTVFGTTLLLNATGTIVDVKCKIECPGVLNSIYYEVEYGPEDDRKTGYVAYGHLTEYIIEDNKEPETVKDPEHSEKNNVTTVLLILAVVVLVLVAIGYVVYTVTSGRKRGTQDGANESKPAEKQKKAKKR